MGCSTPTKETRLTGDWTISGVIHQAETLMNLSSLQGDAQSGATILLDCSGIEDIDMTGLQLLSVWLQCEKMRGIQPGLVNIPDNILKSIERIGFHSALLDTFTASSQTIFTTGDSYEC